MRVNPAPTDSLMIMAFRRDLFKVSDLVQKVEDCWEKHEQEMIRPMMRVKMSVRVNFNFDKNLN